MNISINLDRRSRPGLYQKLEHASEVLESALGNSAGLSHAQWDLILDQGLTGPRDLIRLTLRDGMTGAVESADFAPDELERDSVLRYRFHDLWFVLLGYQSQRHRERFEQMVGPEEGA